MESLRIIDFQLVVDIFPVIAKEYQNVHSEKFDFHSTEVLPFPKKVVISRLL
jgi:hypothetical protein